jgi:hypothetical protein
VLVKVPSRLSTVFTPVVIVVEPFFQVKLPVPTPVPEPVAVKWAVPPTHCSSFVADAETSVLTVKEAHFVTGFPQAPVTFTQY